MGGHIVLAPKGVYKSSTNGYRVQLTTMTPEGKFSRNAPTFEDAVWLYEIAILIFDGPETVDELLAKGNYESIASLRVMAA